MFTWIGETIPEIEKLALESNIVMLEGNAKVKVAYMHPDGKEETIETMTNLQKDFPTVEFVNAYDIIDEFKSHAETAIKDLIPTDLIEQMEQLKQKIEGILNDKIIENLDLTKDNSDLVRNIKEIIDSVKNQDKMLTNELLFLCQTTQDIRELLDVLEKKTIVDEIQYIQNNAIRNIKKVSITVNLLLLGNELINILNDDLENKRYAFVKNILQIMLCYLPTKNTIFADMGTLFTKEQVKWSIFQDNIKDYIYCIQNNDQSAMSSDVEEVVWNGTIYINNDKSLSSKYIVGLSEFTNDLSKSKTNKERDLAFIRITNCIEIDDTTLESLCKAFNYDIEKMINSTSPHRVNGKSWTNNPRTKSDKIKSLIRYLEQIIKDKDINPDVKEKMHNILSKATELLKQEAEKISPPSMTLQNANPSEEKRVH